MHSIQNGRTSRCSKQGGHYGFAEFNASSARPAAELGRSAAGGAKTMASFTLPGWRTDWLYALVLREAERMWTRHIWQSVLVLEYDDAEGAGCRGEIARSWLRDQAGFREITPAEREQLTAELRARSDLRVALMMFHITPDRQRVALSYHLGPLSGQGSRYLVRGTGDEATLERDPDGGFWVS